MSTRNVRAFYDKVAEDKALQARLSALHKDCGGNKEEEVAGLVTIAAATGCVFTAGDLARVLVAKPRILAGTEWRKTVKAEDCWEGKNYFCNATYICGTGVYH